MEMGMGIHGEPGIWRDNLKSADDIVDEMFQRLHEDSPLSRGDTISILVNSLGATPPEELYIMYQRIKPKFDDLGVNIVMPLVGRYATSMEMAGATITICKLDDELESLLKAPADCAFWRL
jgi:dihydroxyacetone kinase-like protein